MRTEDITAAETLKREIEANAAGIFIAPPTSVETTTFGIIPQRPDAPPDAPPLEAWHRTVAGSGHTLDEAMNEFRLRAEMPFPSLMPRMTVYWRRMPMITRDADFSRDTQTYRITARYSLILDMPNA